MVPRTRLEESHRLTETLRTENARLKDQVLSLQTQNRDFTDRAVDDLRRLTAREQAIDRMQRSIHSYQDERDRMAEAYQRLMTSLGRSSEDAGPGRTMGSRAGSTDSADGVRAALHEAQTSKALSPREDGDDLDSSNSGPAGHSGP
jgi:chromosome segregation ATPase